MFGPASPHQYGQNKNAFGIYKNVYCSPCVNDFLTPPCRGDNQCMKLISVDEVASLCSDIFSDSSAGEIVIPAMSFEKTDGETALGIVEKIKKGEIF